MAIPPDDVRVADAADIPAAAAVLSRAFGPEAFWVWAFPDPRRRIGQLERLFAFELAQAVPHGWTLLAGGGAAVALWLPPGVQEAHAAASARVALLRELAGDDAERILRVYAAEAASHPPEPHAHLSLVGVDPGRQGRGLGLGLVAAGLERVDGEGLEARLTATNPRNAGRYLRLGFRRDGEIPSIGGAPAIALMRRPPRSR
jgi:predicted N-acetyltransferase YhbS